MSMPKQCFQVIASTQQLGNRSKRATSEPEKAGGGQTGVELALVIIRVHQH